MASIANTRTKRPSSLAVIATDGELLMRFRRHRDEAAFAEVVERHGRLVWIVCKQALGHHQDVEDAFQATFLILAQRASTIRASESAAAWLYRVAQRTAIAARKRRAKLREEELTVEPPQGEEALPMIQDRQMLRVLMEELKALPQRYQTPLVMQYFEGQSRRAIAEQTDSTLAQIQGRLVRGKRMLRSRLMRRGVSLSLAAGAVAAANTSASAAVSPSLVAATAACSSSFLASGATGNATPAAAELSKQGLNAMWYASLTKTVGTAASVLIVAGVLFAAQSGDDGLANVTVGQAANGVDLQATVAAVAEEEEPAAITVAAAEPAKAGAEKPEDGEVVDLSPTRQLELERDSWLLKAKAFRMKAELKRKFADEHSTSRIRAVSQTELREARADAMLLEADANDAEAKAIGLAREAAARKASAGGPTADDQASDEVKIFSLLNSDAVDILLMLQEQFGAGPLKFSADARTNSIVAQGPESDLAVVEALLTRLDSTGDEQQKRDRNVQRVDEIERELENLEQYLRDINLPGSAMQLEKEQLEQALLQRELERLHEIQLQINSPLATTPGAGESNLRIQGEDLERLKKEVQEELDNTKGELQLRMKSTSKAVADLEEVKREQRSIERQLEQLHDRRMQLVYPQETATGDPIQVRHLKSAIRHLEMELASKDAQLMARRGTAARNPYGASGAESSENTDLGPRDVIIVKTRGVLPNEPIDDAFVIESMGTVALGPAYGRVELAGLSLIEAEKKIKAKLSEIVDPEGLAVQVTLAAKMPAEAGPGESMRTLPRAPPSGNTFSLGGFSSVTDAEIQKLQAEYEALRKRFPELLKPQPASKNAASPRAEVKDTAAEIAMLRATLKAAGNALDRAFQERDTLRQENEELKKQVEELPKKQSESSTYSIP